MKITTKTIKVERNQQNDKGEKRKRMN